MKSLLRIGFVVTMLLLSHSLTYEFAAQTASIANPSNQVRQISEYQYVDKECRINTDDKIGIDVDQTCFEVRTAIGGIVVIPNPHNDVWAQEIADEMRKPQARRDKWLVRFYDLGGGKLSKP